MKLKADCYLNIWFFRVFLTKTWECDLSQTCKCSDSIQSDQSAISEPMDCLALRNEQSWQSPINKEPWQRICWLGRCWKSPAFIRFYSARNGADKPLKAEAYPVFHVQQQKILTSDCFVCLSWHVSLSLCFLKTFDCNLTIKGMI